MPITCMFFFLLLVLQRQFSSPVSNARRKYKTASSFVGVIYGASLEKNIECQQRELFLSQSIV